MTSLSTVSQMSRHEQMTYLTTATTPELTVVETGRPTAQGGDTVGVRIEPANIHLFDRQSELAI